MYLKIVAICIWRKSSSSLVVISGRRRIGKSTLVEVFAERTKCRFIEIEGLAPDKYMTNEKQIANFCSSLARATASPEVKADSWPKAFDALDAALAGRGRKIVFLDEISWMGGYDTSFAAYLKNAWDMQFSRHPHVVFVLAGSVSAWIQENILQSKGFVGRISLDVTLPELPLSDCRGGAVQIPDPRPPVGMGFNHGTPVRESCAEQPQDALQAHWIGRSASHVCCAIRSADWKDSTRRAD